MAAVIRRLLVNTLHGVLQSQTVTGMSAVSKHALLGSNQTAPGPAVNTHFSPAGRQVISEEGHLHHRCRRYSTGKVQAAYWTCGPYQEVGLGVDIQSQACSAANLVQEDQSRAIRIAPRGRVTSARRRPLNICSPVKRAETFGMRVPFHGIMGRGGGGVGVGGWVRGRYLASNTEGINLVKGGNGCQSCDTLHCYLTRTGIMETAPRCKTRREEDDVTRR